MNILKSVILRGWPENKKELPESLAQYCSARDEFTVHDGLVFKGERIVVPVNMRTQVKSLLHSSHLGKESMLRRAREYVYRPGMTDQIKQITESCEACQTYSRAQQKESLMSIEANYPWEIVVTDLFTFEDHEYLLTIDYFSGFWEVDYLPKTTSLAVIKTLKIHFSRYGIPNQLISESGPQFVSKEFSSFTKVWDIVHCTSSPRHPNANGKAESGVKAAKTMMSKCKSSKMDPYLCLLEL
ncbi:protein NYNRIN-like [Haliotis rufescens]|uniref:protein NYNRIN-like n=1 Tax=Haliotis rufescens TaxID=6454 RepID=UPI001EAFB7F7|nr:protein NYNRIN-like [Haliotis rufescens]